MRLKYNTHIKNLIKSKTRRPFCSVLIKKRNNACILSSIRKTWGKKVKQKSDRLKACRPHWYNSSRGGRVDFSVHVEIDFSLCFLMRRPGRLVPAAVENARLSVSIHGILILFLCLEREGVGWGDRILWMLLFTGEWSRPNSEPPWLLLRNRPQIICPQCHIQQPQSSGLPFLRDTTPRWCGLCSCWLHSWAGELMKRHGDGWDYYSG